jgi:cell division septation protein DedD
VASHTQDDGFHEIQLNGKQLVFLFMAATVVSVVFFLCGVWVGRGVRAERSAGSDSAALIAAAEPTPQPAPAAAPPPAGSDPRVAAPPPPPAEDLSYYNRLEKSKPSSENLKAAAAEKPAAVPDKPAPVSSKPAADVSPKPVAAEKPAAVPATPAAAPEKPASTADKTTVPVASAPAQKAAAAPPPPPPSAAPDPAPAAFAAPAGPGYAVQIAALNVRTEADAIAKRLTSKGYSAYVLAPSAGTPKVFRVRVGKFPTRKEAESVATKLQKEEQFKPWITR